jgi:hypothetical protein
MAQGAASLWVGSTTGQMCQLDLRSGLVRRCWQAHQGLVSGILCRPSGLCVGRARQRPLCAACLLRVRWCRQLPSRLACTRPH